MNKEHETLYEKQQTAEKILKDFSSCYSKLAPVIEPERQELAALLKELPIEEIKNILRQLKRKAKINKQ
ncbi:MAG: hypothetical protein WCS27_11590 [Victivallaceae bacterium]